MFIIIHMYNLCLIECSYGYHFLLSAQLYNFAAYKWPTKQIFLVLFCYILFARIIISTLYSVIVVTDLASLCILFCYLSIIVHCNDKLYHGNFNAILSLTNQTTDPAVCPLLQQNFKSRTKKVDMIRLSLISFRDLHWSFHL